MSFEENAVVCIGTGAGLGGNWPLVPIKSPPAVFVLRLAQMTEVQLGGSLEAGL